MYQKTRPVLLLILAAIAAITACSPPTLSEINCQPTDVTTNPPFIHIAQDAFVPASSPFPDQMTDYNRVALTENQLTITDVLCTIRVYESADLAASSLELLCLQSTGDRTEEPFGEAACGFQNEGIKEIHFQQGDTVVTIREDAGGTHASQWATAVYGRLAD
jgi:hypothetical protein